MHGLILHGLVVLYGHELAYSNIPFVASRVLDYPIGTFVFAEVLSSRLTWDTFLFSRSC
jgi:hypothetical protein